MSARARVKQAEATRLMRAAVAAGLRPTECIMEPTGEIRLVFNDNSASVLKNPLDRLLPR